MASSLGIEAGRGLVEEQQLRIADERQREVEAPPLAPESVRIRAVALSARSTSAIISSTGRGLG